MTQKEKLEMLEKRTWFLGNILDSILRRQNDIDDRLKNIKKVTKKSNKIGGSK